MKYSVDFGRSLRAVRSLAPLAAGLAACLGFATDAQAVVLMKESFNYEYTEAGDPPAPTTLLAGLNGGTGFTEAYDAGVGAGQVISNGSLSFPGYTATGNALKVDVNGNLTNGGRNWGTTPTAETTGEWWYSFLIHVTTLTRTVTAPDGTTSEVTTSTRGQVSPFMSLAGNQEGHGLRIDNGLEGGAPGADGQLTTALFRARHPAGGYSGADSVTFVNGYDQTYFVLGNFELTANPGDPDLGIPPSQGTRTTLWVYNAAAGLPTEEPAVKFGAEANDPTDNQTTVGGGGVATHAFDFGLGGRLFSFGGIGSAPAMWDEFIVGETFADVLPAAATPLLGDYNNDGAVDAEDYTVWLDNLGGDNATLSGNGDETLASAGVVDAADFDLWKSRFGTTSGGSLLSTAAVPEPASLLTVAVAAIAVLGFRRR